MRKITAKPLTVEAFAPYGSFSNMLEPQGNCLPGGSFFPDQVRMPVSGSMPVAFSPMVVNKPEKMVITKAEYHTYTAEAVLFLDDDVILHVAPPSNHQIVPQLTEAFIVPKGVLIKMNTAVWHLSPWPLHNPVAHAMVILPERIYANDCIICDFPPEEYIEVVL